MTCPASIPLSTRTLAHLADLLRGHRRAIGCRWRRLDPERQALLVLAHLRNGDTYTKHSNNSHTKPAWPPET